MLAGALIYSDDRRHLTFLACDNRNFSITVAEVFLVKRHFEMKKRNIFETIQQAHFIEKI
jgi:hypothetical protein